MAGREEFRAQHQYLHNSSGDTIIYFHMNSMARGLSFSYDLVGWSAYGTPSCVISDKTVWLNIQCEVFLNFKYCFLEFYHSTIPEKSNLREKSTQNHCGKYFLCFFSFIISFNVCGKEQWYL